MCTPADKLYEIAKTTERVLVCLTIYKKYELSYTKIVHDTTPRTEGDAEMEKTMARAIYKCMEIGKPYTTRELFDMLGDDYYKYIPVELQGKSVNKIVSAELWKVVKAGYAKTYTDEEVLPLVKGLRYGTTPTCFNTYNFRYWTRVR